MSSVKKEKCHQFLEFDLTLSIRRKTIGTASELKESTWKTKKLTHPIEVEETSSTRPNETGKMIRQKERSLNFTCAQMPENMFTRVTVYAGKRMRSDKCNSKTLAKRLHLADSCTYPITFQYSTIPKCSKKLYLTDNWI